MNVITAIKSKAKCIKRLRKQMLIINDALIAK